MSTLLDLLEDGAASGSTIWFPDEGGERQELGALWEIAGRAGAALSSRTRTGVVAMLLSASTAGVATLVGALRGGVTVLSLPHPPRNATPEEYGRMLDRLLGIAGADLLVVDPEDVAHDELVTQQPVMTFEDLLRHTGPAVEDGTPGSLIQCTSGSTSDPKGICLTTDAIASNCRSLLAANLHEHLSLCSWLPLSHDMGLLSLLAAWCSFGPDLGGKGAITQMRPQQFIARPMSWLVTCSDVRATVTAGPNYAYDVIGHWLDRSRSSIDLQHLQVALVGAEPVRAATLRRFAEGTARFGFDPAALSPAYGLAEATVGVTMSRLGVPWTSTVVDPVALGEGTWSESNGTRELVSCGPPLPGVEVRAQPEGGADVGVVEIRSDSLLDRYLHLASRPVSPDGWFRTSDLGAVVGGELYVTGRVDDLIFVAGRNVDASDIEEAVTATGAVRPGSCVAVPNDEGGYLIIAERRSAHIDHKETARSIRGAAARHVRVGPSAVVLVRLRALPRTSSGKVQRKRAADLLRTGALTHEHRLDLR